MPENSFSHLVVVGASAGGIEALSTLVSTLPGDLSAPVVIAQHLDPGRESNLRHILARHSTLPVRTVEDREHLEPGVVYVVPANHHVNITDHEIGLRKDYGGRPKPSVDLLLSSAAGVFGERLIAVILTGTGSDGTEGARDVHAAGGTVVIQDPESARFGEMPRSLAPNTVDLVCELERIGPTLKDLLERMETADELPPDEKKSLEGFLEEVRERHGIDFKSYKTPTIMRRLKRRMVATSSKDLGAYSRYLDEHPEEYRQLVNAFLIKVTEFFRDPELYAHLRDEVLPELVRNAREEGSQLRIWSAGCATGEEPYSLAIMLSEILGEEAGRFDVRIFATDIDEEAINFARRGVYPASALGGLSEEQIRRYFVEEDDHYQVKKSVRSMIVFGNHDLARRSPFPRLDMVVSRNVLIYFTAELQRRALRLFAYSLKDGGYLVLGKAETTSPLGEFFALTHRRHKVYRRQGERFLMPPAVPAPTIGRLSSSRERRPATLRPPQEAQRAQRRGVTEESVLNQLPVGVVVVDRHYDVLAINHAARRLLAIHGSAVGEDLLHTIREAPYAEIRRTIDAAFRDGETASTAEFAVEEVITGEPRYLRLVCHPRRSRNDSGPAETVVIMVNDVTGPARERRALEERMSELRAEFEAFRREAEAEANRQRAQNDRLIETNRLLDEANRELTSLNEDLQTANEESTLSTEEAQAATEEVETLNEELQATNEELETLNEELQATIEELNTTNDDLQARSVELQELARSAEEEQARLRTILESVPEAVLVVNSAGRTVFANDAYRRLFAGDDFTFRDAGGEAMPDGDTPRTRVARGESFVVEFTVDGDDGARRLFEAKGRPVGHGDEGMGGVIVFQELSEEAPPTA